METYPAHPPSPTPLTTAKSIGIRRALRRSHDDEGTLPGAPADVPGAAPREAVPAVAGEVQLGDDEQGTLPRAPAVADALTTAAAS